ncbi:oligosaccharide flippase family protein [uncultured Duncaniella sp.]|uniref:lipopolysaccharide biosynthesis protein n=1 Tax=uncultured Duncaniella sp. TaxID=2768039 RepID=UPI0025A988DF|nr:oligosaccharide flippase family protein [uncultured Duncaniella sp.]
MAYNYYISSFFWSTVGKLFSAVLNFITIPILIGLWGQADYGILAIALACNGYMQLMDLGINNGAIRYFSIWLANEEISKLHRAANSNTIFYFCVGTVNALCLLAIAFLGERWFNISHEQFIVLRNCLIILAVFSIPTWITTSFNQLLIADKDMTFTQQTYCLMNILKGGLIACTIFFKLSLEWYFVFLTAIISATIIPVYIRSRYRGLCSSFKMKFYWKEFKSILSYSIALFALSIFQMTATNSRPIILSVVAENAANTLAEYRIIEVIPVFILSIGGIITSILLPKSSEYIATNNRSGIEKFAYLGTRMTSMIACVLTFPFILGADKILSAYVGVEFSDLSVWLILWSATILLQIHTTPGNSLILASGKTKILVWTSAISCLLSMMINVALCHIYGVGSAVIGYAVYVVIIIGSYYTIYYKSLLHLNRITMIKAFSYPVIVASISLLMTKIISDIFTIEISVSERMTFLVEFIFESLIWLIIFGLLVSLTKIARITDIKFHAI